MAQAGTRGLDRRGSRPDRRAPAGDARQGRSRPVRSERSPNGARSRSRSRGTRRAADPDRETALFYVCSEALANTIKHARASRISIDLRRERDDLVIAVSDDGIGGAHVVRVRAPRPRRPACRVRRPAPRGQSTRSRHDADRADRRLVDPGPGREREHLAVDRVAPRMAECQLVAVERPKSSQYGGITLQWYSSVADGGSRQPLAWCSGGAAVTDEVDGVARAAKPARLDRASVEVTCPAVRRPGWPMNRQLSV